MTIEIPDVLDIERVLSIDSALNALALEWGHPEYCECDAPDQDPCRDQMRWAWMIAKATLAAVGVPSSAAPLTSIAVLHEVAEERDRQDSKWGEQNHPDADPVILARLHGDGPYDGPAAVAGRLAEEHGIPTAGRARRACQVAAERGETNWMAILVEELAETLEATTVGDAALRPELVQLAAVAVAWIEAIDRRQATP